jgi:hypothetical protein
MIQGFIRILLLIFQTIFLAIGLALLILGSVVTSELSNYYLVMPSGYAIAPAVLLVTGIVIFIIALIGCCGSFTKNKCCINIFIFGVSLLLLLQFIALILGLVFKSKIEQGVHEGMRNVVLDYHDSKVYQEFQDGIHKEFKCCGVDSFWDWNSLNITQNAVPESCCINKGCDTTVPPKRTPPEFYTQGCSAKVIEWLKSNASILIASAAIVCFIQAIAVVLSCIYVKKGINRYEMV